MDLTSRYENMSVILGRVRQSWNSGRMNGSMSFLGLSREGCFVDDLRDDFFLDFYLRNVCTAYELVWVKNALRCSLGIFYAEKGLRYLRKMSNSTLTFSGILVEVFLI